MKLTLLNCYDDHIDVEIGKLEDVTKIQVIVFSGDELIWVFKKNGEIIKEDSDRHFRRIDDYNGSYTIYDSEKGINKIEEWKNRHDSLDWTLKIDLYHDGE